jgi:hypothetical protein
MKIKCTPTESLACLEAASTWRGRSGAIGISLLCPLETWQFLQRRSNNQSDKEMPKYDWKFGILLSVLRFLEECYKGNVARTLEEPSNFAYSDSDYMLDPCTRR